MKTTLRKGVAMIELIFSIVVMGIVLMSAPMLMSTAAKSGYVGLQQEGINEASTMINMIMSYHWDENNADPSYIDNLLVVTNGESELDQAGTTKRRIGTPKESSRAFVREDGTANLTASPSTSFGEGNDNGSAETENDDIDDFHGTTVALTTATAGVDYADTIQIVTAINYIDDKRNYNSSSINFTPAYANIAGDPTSNIKHIQVTLTSTSGVEELDKTIVLHAFSSNIGAYKFEERDF
jgi:archaellin